MGKKLALSVIAAAGVFAGMLIVGCRSSSEKSGKQAPPEVGSQSAKRGPSIEGGESGTDFMNKFDLDKDGKISHDEWEAVKPITVYREKHWPEYNINKDSYITMDEVPVKGEAPSEPAPPEPQKKGPTAAQVAFVVKFDRNQDGKLSKDEYQGKFFDVFYRNHDGFIEPEESPAGKTAY